MDKQKRAKCPNGTRKFKPLGDGCYTDEQIENHKKTKKRKEEPSVLTPFRIEDAQYATPSPLITAHKVGVLNEKRCKC